MRRLRSCSLALQESLNSSVSTLMRLQRKRSVVLGYPVRFSLDPILHDSCVTFTRKCTYSGGHSHREPTHQVLVTFTGGHPNSIRRYTPERLRCFKCQAFRHIQSTVVPEKFVPCAAAGTLPQECISTLWGGERCAAHYQNCGMGHHTWSKLCPERLRRLLPSSKDGQPGHKENSDT